MCGCVWIDVDINGCIYLCMDVCESEWKDADVSGCIKMCLDGFRWMKMTEDGEEWMWTDVNGCG